MPGQNIAQYKLSHVQIKMTRQKCLSKKNHILASFQLENSLIYFINIQFFFYLISF